MHRLDRREKKRNPSTGFHYIPFRECSIYRLAARRKGILTIDSEFLLAWTTFRKPAKNYFPLGANIAVMRLPSIDGAFSTLQTSAKRSRI